MLSRRGAAAIVPSPLDPTENYGPRRDGLRM
jgi:hypothetical protein